MNLFGFIIRIYHDARSPERKGYKNERVSLLDTYFILVLPTTKCAVNAFKITIPAILNTAAVQT